MRGKAQCDSPIIVLLAPPGEYDWNLYLLRPSTSNEEDGSNDCPVRIQQQHKKSAKVAILNSFCTIHVPITDIEWMK